MERINDRSVFGQLKVDMWKLGVSTEPDKPQNIASGDFFTGSYPDRAKAHMAILGAPAIGMVNHHPVATFNAGYVRCQRIIHRDVGGSVAHGPDTPIGSGQYGHARTKDLLAKHQPEIGTLMAVIGQGSAGEIPRPFRGIKVCILLDKTILPQSAVKRAGPIGRRGKGGAGTKPAPAR